MSGVSRMARIQTISLLYPKQQTNISQTFWMWLVAPEKSAAFSPCFLQGQAILGIFDPPCRSLPSQATNMSQTFAQLARPAPGAWGAQVRKHISPPPPWLQQRQQQTNQETQNQRWEFPHLFESLHVLKKANLLSAFTGYFSEATLCFWFESPPTPTVGFLGPYRNCQGNPF